MDISKLEPAIVWRHFSLLCNVPRPSGHEAAIREAVQAWAVERGLQTEVDTVGNLLIRKPATPGREAHPGVVMQAHLDMVCQKNAGCAHDFLRDPIHTELHDGWLVAPETTLGADNGMGVALALAALEADNLEHPPLEVLLTIDEEAGMTGVKGLEPGWLRGKRLLNIDTEDWGEFYLGCAGGADVEVHEHFVAEPAPVDGLAFRLSVRGLRGGHSGVDIHLQRGNAIKLLVRALRYVETDAGVALRIAALEGGTARNALPREAWADVIVETQAVPAFKAALDRAAKEFAYELAGVDDGVALTSEALPAVPAQVVPQDAARRLLAALHAAPHGVRRMSMRVAGVVETSNNLGVVRVSPEAFEANLMVRSLVDAGTDALSAEIVSLFELGGFKANRGNGYPGWAPNPESPLLALLQEVHRSEFGQTAEVKVIHAGLECGILGSKYPDMDMVSFGPTIRGAHAPGERVEIESVGLCWKLLQATLSAM